MQCYSATVALSVESQIVGYRTDEIADGKLVARGFAFMNISGEDLSIMTDVTFTNPTGGTDADCADKIRIWSPTESGYTTYFYYVEEGEGYVWHEENWLDEDEDPEVAKLYQGDIPAGQAFWYQCYLAKGFEPKTDKTIQFVSPFEKK